MLSPLKKITYRIIFILFVCYCTNVLLCNASNLSSIQPFVNEVEDLIKQKYITKDIDNDSLKNGAIDGILRNLDPYSAYFDEEEFKVFQDNTNGKFYGIGIEVAIDRANSCPIITNVFSNSPASMAKLLIGDVVTHINDVATAGLRASALTKLIRGTQDTIKLTLYRRSTNETFTKTLQRREVKIPNVISRIYDDDIAIVEIRLFNQQTYADFVDQMNKINGQCKLSGLVLDLRNNPGGLLEAAVDISNLFLSDGQLITSIRGRDDKKVFDYIASNGSNTFIKDLKVVVLINRNSASASEILAGCLKDHGVAKLVGEKTFGKALVQEIFKLKRSKGVVKLTTGQYYTPKNYQINGKGIEPDVKVK